MTSSPPSTPAPAVSCGSSATPNRRPSVKAGGIAAEIAARADAETIPAARLTVNRRQVDPDDRHALHILRCGDAHASQQLRREHGWEHTAATPEDTRRAMADAVTADILASGAESTIALVVSHAQAEDLTDRIRRRLTDAGTLTGTVDHRSRMDHRSPLPSRRPDAAPHPPRRPPLPARQRHRRHHRPTVDDRGVLFRPDRGEPVRLPAALHPRQSGGRVTERVPRLGTHRRRRPGRHLGPRPPARHRRARRLPRLHRPIPLHPPHPHLEHRHPADRRLRRPPRPRSRPRRPSRRRPLPHPRHHDGRRQRPVDRRHRTASADRSPPGHPRPSTARPTTRARPGRPPTRHGPRRRSPPPKPRSTTSAATSTRSACSLPSPDTVAPNDVRSTTGCSSRQAAAIDAAGPVATAEARVERLHPRTGRPRPATSNSTVGAAMRSTTPGERLDQHWTDVALACVRADQTLAYGVEPLRIGRRHLAGQLATIEASLPPDRGDERDRARIALRTRTAATARRRTTARATAKARSTTNSAGAGHGATRPPSARQPTKSTPPADTSPSTEPTRGRGPWTPRRPQPPSEGSRRRARRHRHRTSRPHPRHRPTRHRAPPHPRRTRPTARRPAHPAPPRRPRAGTRRRRRPSRLVPPSKPARTPPRPRQRRRRHMASARRRPQRHTRPSPASPIVTSRSSPTTNFDQPTGRPSPNTHPRSTPRPSNTPDPPRTADSNSSSASDPESRSLLGERIPGDLSRSRQAAASRCEAETCLREP